MPFLVGAVKFVTLECECKHSDLSQQMGSALRLRVERRSPEKYAYSDTKKH